METNANKPAGSANAALQINNFDDAQAYMNQHLVGAAPASHFEPGGKFHFTAAAAQQTPSEVLTKICGGYQILKPVIGWAIRLLPSKWGVSKWFALLDQICAGSSL